MSIAYPLLVVWFIFSFYYCVKTYRTGTLTNKRLLDAIPPIFTTIGVFGTFLGIYFGLQKFNVADITGSIPTLLEGLKTAFMTSLVGIFLSVIFSIIISQIHRSVEEASGEQVSDELDALSGILGTLRDIDTNQSRRLDAIQKALIGDSEDSLSTQMVNLNLKFSDMSGDLVASSREQSQKLDELNKTLGSDTDSSLITQLKKLRIEGQNAVKKQQSSLEKIIESNETLRAQSEKVGSDLASRLDGSNAALEELKQQVVETKKDIAEQMNSLGELLAKNNTEALVHVMEAATRQFNEHMSELIDRLVKENFEELNQSVKNMNDWQQKNMQAMEQLTTSMKSAGTLLETASGKIDGIATGTERLVKNDGYLSDILKEIHAVMAEDTGLKTTTHNLSQVVKRLEQANIKYDGATDKLVEWIQREESFKQQVQRIIDRLKEIEAIRDYNQEFWSKTREQMQEGVSIIKNGAGALNTQLEELRTSFYEMLNNTLVELDSCIQSMVKHYEGNGKA